MQGSANAFTPDANKLAAFTGKGNPQLVAPLYVAAGTTTVDEAAGEFQQIVTAVGNSTVNTIGVGLPGQSLVLEIANDAGGARTITLGANIRGTGNLVGTASKSMLLALRSNGVKWMEVSRTVAIT